MRPAYNFETKYRVTTLNKNSGPGDLGLHPQFRGSSDIQMGPGHGGGTEARVYGQSAGRSLSITLGTYATVLQVEITAMLACAYEIHVYVRPEKYVSICSDSQAAKMTSQLVQQCQKAMNDISTQHSVGLFRLPDILGHEEM